MTVPPIIRVFVSQSSGVTIVEDAIADNVVVVAPTPDNIVTLYTGASAYTQRAELANTASFAYTAAYAENAGDFDGTASFAFTAAFAQNVVQVDYTTGSYTGSFVGEFIGDASQLYNLPLSGSYAVRQHVYEADGILDLFNLSESYAPTSLHVSVDGLMFCWPLDYEVSTNELQFTSVPPSQSIIQIKAIVGVNV